MDYDEDAAVVCGGKRPLVDVVVEEEEGGGKRRVVVVEEEEEGGGKKRPGVASLRLYVKTLKDIVNCLSMVSTSATLSFSPEELKINSNNVSKTLGFLASLPPSFFVQFNGGEHPDVVVKCKAWLDVLKMDDSADNEVELSFVGTTIEHTFYTQSNRRFMKHTLPTITDEEPGFFFTIAAEYSEMTVRSADWKRLVEGRAKVAETIVISFKGEDAVRMHSGEIEHGNGSRELTVGGDLLAVRHTSDATAPVKLRLDYLLKAAKAMTGLNQLVLRFAKANGMLEQHCALANGGRMCVFIVPCIEED